MLYKPTGNEPENSPENICPVCDAVAVGLFAVCLVATLIAAIWAVWAPSTTATRVTMTAGMLTLFFMIFVSKGKKNG